MDWASELAIELMSGHDSDGVLDLSTEELAKEFRKTKAAGMREAVEIILDGLDQHELSPSSIWRVEEAASKQAP